MSPFRTRRVSAPSRTPLTKGSASSRGASEGVFRSQWKETADTSGSKKSTATSTAVIPAKNPDFLLKIDNRLIRIIKFTMAVGAREAVSNTPRFTEEQVSIVRKAVKGDKLVILAEAMMPDGKPNTVTYTATIK